MPRTPVLLYAVYCLLSGCSGSGGAAGPVTVGGVVSGLAGSGLTLTDNGGDELAVAHNGSFVFASRIPVGTDYAVAVKVQPTEPIQMCVVGAGSGVAGSADVTRVTVTCTTEPLVLFAGNMGGPGSIDGTGAGARFNLPYGVATDSEGNVYVADSLNDTIRKITPAGVATTFAGQTGFPGSTDGIGAAAQFNTPEGIAIDAAGNLYVADQLNSTIRKITPAGLVTTLAGAPGVTGSADGIGAAARFWWPSGIAADSAGTIYVADSENSTIRKITPAGSVTTLAGQVGIQGTADGVGSAAQFSAPQGLTVDAAGTIYVADSDNATIRKMTPAGLVTTLAGVALARGSADGTGAAARFSQPIGITTDAAGDIYVADSAGSNAVRKVTPAGAVTTFAGTFTLTGSSDGTGAAARFSQPIGVAADPAGDIYVADSGENNTIRKITPAAAVTTLAGAAALAGSADGIGAAARFSAPFGITTDAAGNVYVADTDDDTVRKITPAGVVTSLAGHPGLGGGADGTGAGAYFSRPSGVAADRAGSVYVADTWNNTIRKVTPGGVVTTLAGLVGVPGSADGIGVAAQFNNPYGITIDASGTAYVADTYNHAIRRITSAGAVTTLAGQPGLPGSADGIGAAAQFNAPMGIAIDTAGNVYVADTDNDTIRKITSTGFVTTLAGQPGVSGSADGQGAAAQFSAPQALSIDAAGNLYVADTDNSTVRKITSAGLVSTIIGVPHQAGFVAPMLPGRIGSPHGVAFSGSSLYIVLYNGVALVQALP